MKYSKDNNKLTVNNIYTIEFKYPIQKTLEYLGKLVVLLDKPLNIKYNDNVFAVDENGKIIWQVSKINTYPGNQEDCPFVDIFINEGKLILDNWCSISVIVDIMTGEVLSKFEHR